MVGSFTAASHRHLWTLWRGEKAWHWLALFAGHAQPIGYRNHWHGRYEWQLHLTPVHLSRHWSQWEAGVCWGRRSLYVRRHR